MNKKKSNVRHFIKKPDLNVGYIVFIVIFLYIAASLIMYAVSKKTVIYEVNSGSLALDNEYKGFIIRSEEVKTSEYSGSVNYFMHSLQKAGVKSVVYTVDETGRVSELINSNINQSLSTSDLTDVRDILSKVTLNYSDEDFDYVYDIRNTISSGIYECQMNKIVENLDDYIDSTSDSDFFHTVKSSGSGIVVYTIDGYENIKESDLNDTLFETDSYKVTNLQTEKLINQGDTAYKLITDSAWSIYIQLNESDAAGLADSKTVGIRFPDSNISCQADFSIITVGGKNYGKISMNKYLVNFSNSRYVDIELTQDGHSGLKIPITSVVKKNFYTIPIEYASASGSFVRKYYGSNGELITDTVTPTIYDVDDKYYYVSTSDFSSGDVIAKADSEDTFVVGTIGELSGVYCVNRGYAVFKKVDIIDQNSEYYIVKRGTSYGLSIYDHIVLDHSTVKEDEIVN